MWLDQTISKRQLQPLAREGHLLYFSIKNILYVVEVRRQEGAFRDILLRLRHGKTTREDWLFQLHLRITSTIECATQMKFAMASTK